MKPSTIYYNSADILKGLPTQGQNQTDRSSHKQQRGPSISEDRGGVSSTPSTPLASRKMKSPQRTMSTVQDAVFGDLVDTATVAALESQIKVCQM